MSVGQQSKVTKIYMVFYFTNVSFDMLLSATNTFNSACKVSTLSRVVRTISLVHRLKVGKNSEKHQLF